MVQVRFLALQLDALKLYGDVNPLQDQAIQDVITQVATTIVNLNIDPRNSSFPFMDYLQNRIMFASLVDERMVDIWFSQGYDYTAADLSNMQMLVLNAGRYLAMDIINTMNNVLNYKCQVQKLTLNGNIGDIWLS